MRSPLALLAVAALLVLAAAPASAAEPGIEQIEEAAKGMRAVTGQLLTSPQPSVVRKDLPVRVAVRVPKGMTKLTVRVGDRDLSGRFRQGGEVRSAKLDRGDGLRYGANTIFVLAQRGKSRPVAHARTFYLVRPAGGLASLRLRNDGAVAAVTLRLRKPSLLSAAHLRKPGAVARQLRAMHRDRTVRLWLNGKRVTRAIGSSRLTSWTAKLSATHGLHYGVNRLRAEVVEPGTGRYQTLRRSFVVKRDRPLASAGWDRYSKVGGHVRLDGRRSRVAGEGERALRWTIVSKPRGSKARLRGAGSVRPRLSPDRPGRYVVRLSVAERGRGKAGARASAASATSSDVVEVTAAPRQLLVPFTGFTPAAGGRAPGIEVAGHFYPKPGQGDFQWLTLSRSSLAPTGAHADNWFDKGASGEHGLEGLYDALKDMGHDQLVILAMPLSADSPVNPEQVGQFNNILNLLGAESIKEADLTATNQQLVVVGVPYSGPGSAWVSRVGGASKEVFDGWLMPDAVPGTNGDLNFRFQPDRIAFDTESASTPTTNTMTVDGKAFPASLPAGSSGGFQVLLIDPNTFAVLDNRVFSTNATGLGGGPLSGREAMAKYLRDKQGLHFHVAVQSIGSVGNFTNAPEEQFVKDMNAAWWEISRALSVYGANPDTFNRVAGPYAFLGGPLLTRAQTADSSAVVAIDPTTNPPLREAGTLQGRAAPTSQGVYEPVIASPIESPDLELYDKVFTPPTPWPLTRAAGLSEREARRYGEALAYISTSLGAGPNIRDTYWTNLETVYSDDISQLQKLPYPGSGRTCGGRRAAPPAGPGRASYTREQFCRMSAQLETEFRLLDKVKEMFDAYEQAFSRSGPVQQAELESLGTAIEEAIKPGNHGGEIVWTVGGFLANLTSAGLVLDPEGAAALAAWEALVTVYELTRELIGDTGGVPVGEQVESKVGELALDLAKKLEASADGVERLRQVIVSDWGRLQAVGSVAGTPGWTVDVPTVKAKLTNSAGAFFSSQLLPIPYGVHLLESTGFNAEPTTENCYTLNFGHTYRGAPETAKLQWMGDFEFQETRGAFPSPFVLAVHSPSALRYSYPPAEITNKMFRPQVQGGYGIHLPQYVWESYEEKDEPPGPSPPTYVAYCH
jgi:hypothetical protein